MISTVKLRYNDDVRRVGVKDHHDLITHIDSLKSTIKSIYNFNNNDTSIRVRYKGN